MTLETNTQPALFDNAPALATVQAVPEIVVRKKARDSAFAKADKWVMDGYRRLLVETVGRVMPTFGAWHVTQLWEKQHGQLSESNRKALGHIYAELLEKKIIRENGTGKRPNGNLACTYSLNR